MIDRAKANQLGITMADIGDTLATLVGGNYVNRFNLEGRSYEVIPQVPRAERLTPDSLGEYYVKTASGRLVPLSTVVRDRHRDHPQRAAPVQPAQLRHPLGRADARRDDGPGGGFPRAAGGRAAAGRLPPRLPVRSRGST